MRLDEGTPRRVVELREAEPEVAARDATPRTAEPVCDAAERAAGGHLPRVRQQARRPQQPEREPGGPVARRQVAAERPRFAHAAPRARLKRR